MKVIAGLGNPGRRYEGTRHNVGFDVVTRLLEGAVSSVNSVVDRGGDSEVAWVRVLLPLHRPRAVPPKPDDEATPEARDAWREAKRAARDATELGPVVLATPLAFMNRSGPPLRRVIEESAADPREDLLVVVDDVDLEAGQLRLRRTGSSGGHRGLESIEQTLGTHDWARLRLGVGRNPPGVPSEDWVLEPARGDDARAIQEGIGRAALAARAWLARGVERAMDEFNRRPTPDSST